MPFSVSYYQREPISWMDHAVTVSVKPRLLDLFCGAGGASMGYHRAGFEVVGVDIRPQPNYPFGFIQSDALEFLDGDNLTRYEFDAIHASPPCQAFTTFAKQAGTTGNHKDLVEPTRRRLRESGLPYVIENVPGAPLEAPLRLCGTMFPGLRVIRHRHFETSFFMLNPLPHGDHPLVHFKHGNRVKEETDEWDDFLCITSGNRDELDAVRDAIGCSWMTRHELAQSIPPAYTEWIGTQLLNAIQLSASSSFVAPSAKGTSVGCARGKSHQ